MLVTWRCTVCSLTTSRSAICRFVSPSASRHSTSRSRGVTSGAASGHRARTRRGSAAPARPRRPRRARACSSGCGCLALSRIAAPERDQAGGELEPRLGRLERRAASLEAIDGVLEQRPRPLVVAARRGEHALRHVRGRAQRRASRPAARSPAEPRAPRRPRPARRARSGRGRAARAQGRGRACGGRALGAAAARPARRPGRVSRWSSARRARQSWRRRGGARSVEQQRAPPSACPAAASAPRARRAGRRPSRGASGRSRRPKPQASSPPRPTGPARGAPRRTRPGRRRACTGSRSAPRTRRSGRTTRTRARSRVRQCTR